MNTPEGFAYQDFVARNEGYVPAAVQEKFRRTRLLIAGCGIGSSPAVCAARMGFENFLLVDGDVVDLHNLNRQFYEFADVGQPKVLALKDKILRINPAAQVEPIQAYLDRENTATIVERADIIFDTVDFLDLAAILELHASARKLRRPIFTALSVGFGALVWYFPAETDHSLVDILAPELATAGDKSRSYAGVFESFIARLVPYLDQEVIEQIGRVLMLMKEGKPCPAPQVAVGSFAIGAMVMSMIHDLLAGRPMLASPKLLIHSFKRQATTIVDIETAKPRSA